MSRASFWGEERKESEVINAGTSDKESEVDSANASGTQALTLRGLSNPGVLRMGVVYRERKAGAYAHRAVHEEGTQGGTLRGGGVCVAYITTPPLWVALAVVRNGEDPVLNAFTVPAAVAGPVARLWWWCSVGCPLSNSCAEYGPSLCAVFTNTAS